MINLSKKKLSKNEYKLLNKNLNFVPNPGKPSKKDLDSDINAYFRRIMLKAHFGSNNQQEYEGFVSGGNGTWLPRDTHHTVKTYIQKVRNDFNSYNPETQTEPF